MIARDNPPTDRAPEKYPVNDVTAEQVESLIASTANLQMQILRKFAKSVLEEMRYHLWVAQEKCRMHEETIIKMMEKKEKYCIWMQDSDGVWNTSCGVSFEFNDGGPWANNFCFCHKCGHELAPTYFHEEQEERERHEKRN